MAGEFPKSEQGYFHLTPTGWVRQDQVPFPQDRCETWLYEMEWPQEDAKERVTLTRIWRSLFVRHRYKRWIASALWRSRRTDTVTQRHAGMSSVRRALWPLFIVSGSGAMP